MLSLLSSLPHILESQSEVSAELPSPPLPLLPLCPACPQGLSLAGASKDWQEEAPLLQLSSRGCLGLQLQSPVLCCAHCGMEQVLGMLKGDIWPLIHGSARGVYGVLQEPERLVPKARGKRPGFASVLHRSRSS